MSDGLITVVILTYKHGEYLLKTIDSVLKQDYSDIEIIIAEDGDPSFDKDKIEGYLKDNSRNNIKRIVFSINKDNVGTVKNINNAIKKSCGEYIKVIAGDDTYPCKDVFSKQIATLSSEQTSYLVVGNMNECDSDMNQQYEIGFKFEDKEYLKNRESLLKIVTKYKPQLLATQAICYRKRFFDEFGLFDERLRLIEDLPMAVKIIMQNVKFSYLDLPCVNHRGSVGVSSSIKKFEKKKLNYYKDLERYFDEILRPYSNIIGKRYVEMRVQLYEFRIKYTEVDDDFFGFIKKLLLLVRYSYPLFYYISERKNK